MRSSPPSWPPRESARSCSSSCSSRSTRCRFARASRTLESRTPRPRCCRRKRVKIRTVAEHDFMPIKGWDHLELYVGNAKQAAYYYEGAFGFTKTAYAGPETGVRDRASYVLDQNEIRLVLTSGLRPDSEITRFACSHGDGVKDVALAVPSASEAYRQAVQRGARSVVEPHWVEDDYGRVELASIATYGENVHTFVNRDDYAGPYLPGYASLVENGAAATGIGLQNIDHVVGNVELGRMEHWVEYYERCFGMTELIHFSDVAMATDDIVATVEELEERGLRFLRTPTAYYDDLEERVGEIDADYDDLQRLGILADRDEEGYLLQIFTKTAQDRPTLFFEVIERHGSRGFGEGNFKALFE